MKPSKSLIIISILTGLLALVQSGVGLFWQAGSGPFTFTTLHGETLQMYGQGIYFYDTYFKAPILRGTDAVTLFLCVPLLLIGLVIAMRGSLRGKLFLTAVLSYFLYTSASISMGAAYNNLFLLYIAYFSASLFAFILAFTSVDLKELAERVSPSIPRRGIAVLLFLAGAALLFAWLTDLISWLQPGAVPGIASYTTEVTDVFDLGIIAPVAFLSGVLILRRAPLGYLLSPVMLIMLAIVGAMVSTQTVFQLSAGISLTPPQLVGKAGSFALLSLFAIWLAIRMLQGIAAKPAPRQAKLKPSRA